MDVDRHMTGHVGLYFTALRRLGHSERAAHIAAADMGVQLGMMSPDTREAIVEQYRDNEKPTAQPAPETTTD